MSDQTAFAERGERRRAVRFDDGESVDAGTTPAGGPIYRLASRFHATGRLSINDSEHDSQPHSTDVPTASRWGSR